MTEFEKKVYNAVKRIPRGKVSTYAVVARSVGKPKAARAVGNALNKNPFRSVPCHRVVRSDGVVGGYVRGSEEKIRLLRREGVTVRCNKNIDSICLFL